jgi:RIO-like serine/threonine protein kinase
MVTHAQSRVLFAINDYCEIHGHMDLDHTTKPLPNLRADLQMPDDQVYQAVGDLFELDLIEGADSSEHTYPVRVIGLTAKGRQELARRTL